MVEIDEEWRVAGHDDEVGVAFQAGHPRGFADGGAEVALAAVAGDGVFADENLRTGLAVVFIKKIVVRHEPLGRVVEMFVHDVGVRLLGVAAFPMVRDELHVGIPLLDVLDEQRPAFAVGIAAVLVADFHVFQIERRGMAGLGAESAPKRIGRAVRVFNRVERVLHPLAHVRQRNALVVVRHAAFDVEVWRCAEVLAHDEVFVVAEAVRGVVFPDIPERCARVNVADGFFPLIHLIHRVALDPATAGEPEKRRVQRVNGLRKVGTQPVIFPSRLGQHGNHVEK